MTQTRDHQVPNLAIRADTTAAPEVKCGFALARSGYAQYPAARGMARGRAFVWLGFRRTQSDFFRAGRPVGHSAKFLCKIGLKAPSKINEKTSDVGLMGGAESSVRSSERPAAVLL